MSSEIYIDSDLFFYLDEKLPGRHWNLTNRQSTISEPKYGFVIYEDHTHSNPVAIAEHDDPYQCIKIAIGQI